MTNEFEHFNDRDEEWLRELELRATDLENDLFDWREAHSRELTDSSSYGGDGTPQRSMEGRPGMLRAQPRPACRQLLHLRPLQRLLPLARRLLNYWLRVPRRCLSSRRASRRTSEAR